MVDEYGAISGMEIGKGTEVLGVSVPQCYCVHHKPTLPDLGSNLGHAIFGLCICIFCFFVNGVVRPFNKVPNVLFLSGAGVFPDQLENPASLLFKRPEYEAEHCGTENVHCVLPYLPSWYGAM
jgi:hypothetical protein